MLIITEVILTPMIMIDLQQWCHRF